MTNSQVISTDDGDGSAMTELASKMPAAKKAAHYIRKQNIMDAAITGEPPIALCGAVWTPGRSGSLYEICNECKVIYEENYSLPASAPSAD